MASDTRRLRTPLLIGEIAQPVPSEARNLLRSSPCPLSLQMVFSVIDLRRAIIDLYKRNDLVGSPCRFAPRDETFIIVFVLTLYLKISRSYKEPMSALCSGYRSKETLSSALL